MDSSAARTLIPFIIQIWLSGQGWDLNVSQPQVFSLLYPVFAMTRPNKDSKSKQNIMLPCSKSPITPKIFGVEAKNCYIRQLRTSTVAIYKLEKVYRKITLVILIVKQQINILILFSYSFHDILGFKIGSIPTIRLFKQINVYEYSFQPISLGLRGWCRVCVDKMYCSIVVKSIFSLQHSVAIVCCYTYFYPFVLLP